MKDKFYTLKNEGGDVDGGGDSGGGAVSDSGGQSAQTMMSASVGDGQASHDPAPDTPTTQAEPARSIDTASILNDKGEFSDSWSNHLGDDFKEHSPTLDRFKNIQDLAKSVVEAKKIISSKAVSYPGEGATDEERGAWNKQALVSENSEKFMEQRWGDNKEGLESFKNTTGMSDEALASIIDESIKSGVPAPALQSQLDAFEKVSSTLRDQYEKDHAQSMEEAHKSLRDDFGNESDAKIQQSIHALDRVAGMAGLDAEALNTLKQDPNFGGNPNVVRMFAAIADSISDAAYKGHNLGSAMATQFRTPMDEAQDIMNNSDNPNHEKFLSGDEKVNSKVDRLLAKAQSTRK